MDLLSPRGAKTGKTGVPLPPPDVGAAPVPFPPRPVGLLPPRGVKAGVVPPLAPLNPRPGVVGRAPVPLSPFPVAFCPPLPPLPELAEKREE